MYGDNYGQGMLKKLEECISQYNEACKMTCAKMYNEGNDLIVVLCSLLMQRVHQYLRSSREVVLFAFEITRGDVLLLKKMIQQHHETFMVQYPAFEITPKFHFLIHLPSQILLFGMSRVTWSMRFEAMHSYFKNLMRITKNFKNPPFSLSYRYANLRCCQMLTLPGEQIANFLVKCDIPSNIEVMKVKDHPQVSLLLSIFGNKELLVKSCHKVKSLGTVFSRGSVVLLDSVLPSFGRVVDIVIYGEMKALILSPLKTTEYHPLCNAFKVCDSEC